MRRILALALIAAVALLARPQAPAHAAMHAYSPVVSPDGSGSPQH